MAQRFSNWRKRRREGLATTPRLLKAALKGFKKNWRQYLLVTGVVAVPVAIVSALSKSEPSISAYINMATMIMNVALIWAILHLRTNKSVTIRQAYYDGTNRLVQFILVAMLLVLMALPMIIGITIYALGTTGESAVVTNQERVILLGLGILVSIPSIIMLARSAFASYVVFEPGMTPIAAIRKSRALVKDRIFGVMGRLVLIGILAVLLFIGLILGVILIQGNANSWSLAGMQLLINVVLMPIFHLYMLNLYWSLKDTRVSE